MSIKVTKNFRHASIAKQLPFAIAKALTQTAKDAQSAILGELPQKFTIRGTWSNPKNKYGVKIKPATKTKQTAEVGTNADWLKLQETGGVKTPKGENIAIPTANVRRTKRQIIQRSQRPRALRGKRDIVLKTKRGAVLFQRKYKGKRSTLVPLYNLEPRARIRRVSPIIEPAKRTVRLRFKANFINALADAMKTAK